MLEVSLGWRRSIARSGGNSELRVLILADHVGDLMLEAGVAPAKTVRPA